LHRERSGGRVPLRRTRLRPTRWWVRVPQGPPKEHRCCRVAPVLLWWFLGTNPRRRGSLREVLPQTLGGSERKRTNKFKTTLHCQRSGGRVPLRN